MKLLFSDGNLEMIIYWSIELVRNCNFPILVLTQMNGFEIAESNA